jgi:hypothetical protein
MEVPVQGEKPICAFTYRLAPKDTNLLEVVLYLKMRSEVSVSYKGPAVGAEVSAAAESATDGRKPRINQMLRAARLPERWLIRQFRDECPVHVRGLPNGSLNELGAGTIRGMLKTAMGRYPQS